MSIKISDVRAVGGDSAFLIDDGKTAILYDSGFAFTGYRVAENIKALLGDRELDYIFLTHSHYDHALGAVYALKVYKNAKVVAGEYAVKIFAKPTAKAVMRDLDRKFALKCGIDSYEDLIDELKVDISVKDGDKIKAGDMEFTAINLPGHTRCSVGYYLESEKLLLSTETIGVYCGCETVIPSYLVGYDITLDSIRRVKALDVKRMLVPHYGVIEGKETERYLELAFESAVTTASELKEILLSGKSKEDAVKFFVNKYYHGQIKDFYPYDAMMLNTSIMVNLIEKELLSK